MSGPQTSPEIVASESDYKDCKHERDLNLESPDGHSQSKKFMEYDEDIISATSVDSSQPYQDGVDSPSTENNPDPQRQNTDADASTNVYVSPNGRIYSNSDNIEKDSDPQAKNSDDEQDTISQGNPIGGAVYTLILGLSSTILTLVINLLANG
eukprot:503581_1